MKAQKGLSSTTMYTYMNKCKSNTVQQCMFITVPYYYHNCPSMVNILKDSLQQCKGIYQNIHWVTVTFWMLFLRTFITATINSGYTCMYTIIFLSSINPLYSYYYTPNIQTVGWDRTKYKAWLVYAYIVHPSSCLDASFQDEKMQAQHLRFTNEHPQMLI